MHYARTIPSGGTILAEDIRFEVRLASGDKEIESALRLRFLVFGEELGRAKGDKRGIECDAHDDACDHLIMSDRDRGQTIGTYRIKGIESANSLSGFYSNDEFSLETLPPEVLKEGLELGRACISSDHRNTRAIFLIWKALARHLTRSGKRYFFGCCSIFTNDPAEGERAFRYLKRQGFVHDQISLRPRRPIPPSGRTSNETENYKLPGLFEMYLHIGSRVCGPPTYDEQFGTVDFFVVFDLQEMNPKYREMFLES